MDAEVDQIENMIESENHSIPVEGMSATSDYDPDTLSQITPISTLKNADPCLTGMVYPNSRH